jgi:hypothetical protein
MNTYVNQVLKLSLAVAGTLATAFVLHGDLGVHCPYIPGGPRCRPLGSGDGPYSSPPCASSNDCNTPPYRELKKICIHKPNVYFGECKRVYGGSNEECTDYYGMEDVTYYECCCAGVNATGCSQAPYTTDTDFSWTGVYSSDSSPCDGQ